MRFIINILRSIVASFDERSKKIIYCNDKWENNPHYNKRTKNMVSAYIASPGCSKHLDNRCCVYCPKISTCKCVCQRGCYVWGHYVFGKCIKSKDVKRSFVKEEYQYAKYKSRKPERGRK